MEHTNLVLNSRDLGRLQHQSVAVVVFKSIVYTCDGSFHCQLFRKYNSQAFPAPVKLDVFFHSLSDLASGLSSIMAIFTEGPKAPKPIACTVAKLQVVKHTGEATTYFSYSQRDWYAVQALPSSATGTTRRCMLAWWNMVKLAACVRCLHSSLFLLAILRLFFDQALTACLVVFTMICIFECMQICHDHNKSTAPSINFP